MDYTHTAVSVDTIFPEILYTFHFKKILFNRIVDTKGINFVAEKQKYKDLRKVIFVYQQYYDL